MKKYTLKLVLEFNDENERGILRSEDLAKFSNEEEAQKTFELIELPDMEHIAVI